MKETKTRCLPLEITNYIAGKYPGCWDYIKEFREDKTMPKWDTDFCYIPIAATITYTMTYGNERSYSTDAGTMAAVAPWRLHKQIYSFPEEMERLLFEQAEDCKLPVDILRNLPYPCIYVEIHTEEFSNGFFFYFESDVNTGGLEMRFIFLKENGKRIDMIPFPVHVISGGTIKDGIDATVKLVKKNARKCGAEAAAKSIIDLLYDDYSEIYKCIQLVLYICAQNREISEDEVQKRVYRKPKAQEYIKDKFREVQKWNMGMDTAQTIRKMNRNPVRYQRIGEHSSAGTGSPKSPHVRRGHWHHFWTGSKNSDNRKQILKWIPPTFINADKVDESDNITRNIVEDK